MSEFINTIELLGDDAVINSIIDRSITEFNDNVVSKIGNYAFYDCKSLESIRLPKMKVFGEYSFTNCSKLNTIDLPILDNIGGYSFQNCTSLVSISLPNLRNTYNAGQFSKCTALTNIYVPSLETVATNFADGCTSLTHLVLPNAKQISQANWACGLGTVKNLVTLDIHSYCQHFSDKIGTRYPKLKNLILRTEEKICQFYGGSHKTCDWTSSLFESGSGYVYAPASLVESYKMNANFSAIASQIRALEDYTVDGTTTGDLDIGTCTSITLSDNELTFVDINSQSLTAITTPKVTDETITWTSSDSTIASVRNGVVTPVATGECVITVTCGDYSSSCDISVLCNFYSVSNNLTLCKTSNSTTVVAEGTSYASILTTYDGGIPDTVSVLMGGVDITDSVYNDGVINIESIVGDIVITASCSSYTVSEPVYSLLKSTTFNGTSDYIDTGIKLFDTAKDLTIICVASFSSLANNACICHCMNEVSPYPGLSVDGMNNSTSICYTGSSSLTTSIGSFSSVRAIALRYTKGVLDSIKYVNTSGEIVTASISGAPIYTKISQNLLLGAYQTTSGEKGRYFKGTISTFDVYEERLNDIIIEYILSNS